MDGSAKAPDGKQSWALDSALFATLAHVGVDRHHVEELEPKDIDTLSAEVGAAYQRCSIPESDIPLDEREVDEHLVRSIHLIDSGLQHRSLDDGGALLSLFREAIMTPGNLEALLRMCNANNRIGPVRCHAIRQIAALMALPSIWSIKLSDGFSVSFGLICSMANFLHDETTCEMLHEAQCSCQYVWSVLQVALSMAKDEPSTILHQIRPYDWTMIFDRGGTPVSAETGRTSCWDMAVFVRLHILCQRILRAIPRPLRIPTYENTTIEQAVGNVDGNHPGSSGPAQDYDGNAAYNLKQCSVIPDEEASKRFLIKLGASHGLFRSALNRIISGDYWLSCTRTSTRSNEDVISDIHFLQVFFHSFTHCLGPLPSDCGTKELMRLACSALRGRFGSDSDVMSPFDDEMQEEITRRTNVVIMYLREGEECTGLGSCCMPAWIRLQDRPVLEESQWQRIQDQVNLVDETWDHRRDKERRRAMKENSFERWDDVVGDSRVCANCYAPEETKENGVEDDGDGSTKKQPLMRCAGCRQISYCSRTCQQEHWKKVHKDRCCQRRNK